MYQYTMFILQSLHLLYNRYKTTVTWYLIHVEQPVYIVYPAIITFAVQQIYNYGHLVPDSCNVPVYNVYPAIITFAVQQIYNYGHLIHVEQIVRNGNSIARMRKRPPLKMIRTTLVSVLFRTFWQLFWTFWQCSINIIYVHLRKFICIHYETGKKAHIAFPRYY